MKKGLVLFSIAIGCVVLGGGLWYFMRPQSHPDGMYICTAADSFFYPQLINLISSIHRVNFDEVDEIAVFDLGLTTLQRKELQKIAKVSLYDIKKTDPHILKRVYCRPGKIARGHYAWKPVVIKQALDMFPTILYIDAGATILRPLDTLFKHIQQNGYLFVDCDHSIKQMAIRRLITKFDLESPERRWILDDETVGLSAGFQGLTRTYYDTYVKVIYDMTYDLKNFIDDGTAAGGYGEGRNDQPIFSILARLNNLDILTSSDGRQKEPIMLTVDGKKVPFHITEFGQHVTNNTDIFQSRRLTFSWLKQYLRYK